jgi:hypothetical protein
MSSPKQHNAASIAITASEACFHVQQINVQVRLRRLAEYGSIPLRIFCVQRGYELAPTIEDQAFKLIDA